MAMTSRMFTLKFRIEAAHCEIDSGLRDSASGMSATQSSASSPALPVSLSLADRQPSGPCRQRTTH
jgi:hypothetical protein